MKESYKVIGLMSGTSLDGLDLAACIFRQSDAGWTYEITQAKTIPYDAEWKNRLSGLPLADALNFSLIHVQYGHYLGRMTRQFMDETGFIPDLVASHGHTVFHQPDIGLTVQVGSGSALAAETMTPVVFDFRSLDVAFGGQGAPLVPVGDQLLFPEFGACLNIGGFANISFDHSGRRIAFDICPANIILNYFAGKLGLEYDKDGHTARSGNLLPELLDALNKLDYYFQPYPKSLGREWMEQSFLPLCNESRFEINDMLHTLTIHIAGQIKNAVPANGLKKILVTGGGAFNEFLTEHLRSESVHDWHIPDKMVVEYKEALVFAFLGLLRWVGSNNVMRSVTGCRQDHSGGSLVFPGSI